MDLILLDADVIIDLHSLGHWKRVTRVHQVYVPSIILHKEVYHYADSESIHHPIDLEHEVGNSIYEIACDPGELFDFLERFDSVFQTEIHAGEKEALILLSKNEKFRFCTCDKSAIKALALIDLSERGISFEKLLKTSGISIKKLEYRQTEAYFKQWLKEGSIMKIQGRGIKKKKS